MTHPRELFVAPAPGVATTAPERLAPAARIAALFDSGRWTALEPPVGDRPIAVIAGVGEVHGRTVVAYAQDSGLGGGAAGRLETDLIVRVLRLARQRGAPVVAFLESAGARLQEGAAALGGLGQVFAENVACTGRVPQISVLTGTAAGGGCYSPALTDFIVMTRAAAMFLTGPRVVQAALGEDVTIDELGGAHVHQGNGVAHFVARDDLEAVATTRELLGYLDGRERPPAPPAAASRAAGDVVPAADRAVYDIRDVARALLDDGRFLEAAPRWARNLVTGFGRFDGAAVGIVANQPRHLGGVLDVHASEKGAWFVRACDDLRVPLLVLVDTPGFLPGMRQEGAGVIRRGAQLVRAFAEATVPRVSVILRKAFGGAYISMNSKGLGADSAIAWEGAEIGIMAPQAAVAILHRAKLNGDRDALADRLAERYRVRHLTAARALELGLLDAVIPAHRTREHVVSALSAASDRCTRPLELSRRRPWP